MWPPDFIRGTRETHHRYITLGGASFRKRRFVGDGIRARRQCAGMIHIRRIATGHSAQPIVSRRRSGLHGGRHERPPVVTATAPGPDMLVIEPPENQPSP